MFDNLGEKLRNFYEDALQALNLNQDVAPEQQGSNVSSDLRLEQSLSLETSSSPIPREILITERFSEIRCGSSLQEPANRIDSTLYKGKCGIDEQKAFWQGLFAQDMQSTLREMFTAMQCSEQYINDSSEFYSRGAFKNLTKDLYAFGSATIPDFENKLNASLIELQLKSSD